MTSREFFSRALNLFRHPRLDRDTQAEMQFHVDMQIEEGVSRGLDRAAAERAARVHAGSVAASIEGVRDERGFAVLDGTLVDLRQAWVSLRRRPSFLIIAGTVLTSAVAVNTLVFTVVDGVLLRPLPYRDPTRLVRIYEASSLQPKFPLSIYNYREDKRSNRTLEGIALYVRDDVQLMHEDRAERLTGVAVTDDFFPTLGVSPAIGRNFVPGEMVQGAHVVILSYGFWKSRFQADRAIIGKTLRLNREDWTVIGVAPEGFQHVGGDYRSPLQGDTVSIWLPLSLDINGGCAKGCHFTNVIARLKPGISIAAAQADLNQIMQDLAHRFPDFYAGKSARLEPLAAEVVGKSRPTILIIMAVGITVLLLACVNIAGLSVARVLARRKEIAVRQALGGTVWRIVRVVLSENLVLGALAAATGLGVAAALLPALHAILPENFPRLHEIVFRWPAALFAVAASLVTSIIAGLLPAFRQTTVDASEALNDDNRGASTSLRTGRLRGGLVAAEMALACLLCFAAVLLLRSSLLLNQRDHGFNPDHVLTFELTLPEKAYNKPEQRTAFYAEVTRKWREIPGVVSAGIATSLPWTGYDENSGFGIVGYVPRPGESLSARYQGAGPGFFETLGTRITQGRAISAADDLNAPKVVVINEALARRYFPRGNALGQSLDIWGANRRIVGIVADIADTPADLTAEPAFWMSLAQQPFGQVRVAIRTAGDPLAFVLPARAAVQSIDRELPVAEVAALDDIAAKAVAERRFALWLCEAFAGLAIALAAIGIYAMLTYVVQQRKREIGIRMALGATRSDVLRMVFTGGLALSATGVAVGLLFAPAAGRALTSLLYGVTPADAVTLAIVPAIIMAVATVGCLAPALMAIRTEPMPALRDN